VVAATGVGHPHGAVEDPLEVEPHQRGRHETEGRERRVAATDGRLAGEHAHAPLVRELLKLRAGVGHGDELVPVGAGLLPVVVELRARLERIAGLRRHDEHRRLQVEELGRVPQHRRVRRVEHVQALHAERALEHLRRQRRAAHAEQHAGLELPPRLVCEHAQLADSLLHALRLVEPAEPPLLAGVGPDRRVARPDALDELLVGRDDHQAGASAPRFAWMPSLSCSSESANFCTPSSSSVLVTSP
jgi:hypothetical protein